METEQFLGSRLRLARAFSALSQKELADSCGVTYQHVGALEKGLKHPSENVVAALAETLGFSPKFFYRKAFDEFLEEDCHFRKRASTPVGAKNLALSFGSLLTMLVEHLDEHLELPPSDVPAISVKSPNDIEEAADRCRVRWGLGLDRPIKNMIRVVENAGVVVANFDAKSSKLDAFSRHGSRNIMVLNLAKSLPARTRFDVSHELGHLVMHGGMMTGDAETESQANRFASAFLFPRTGFLREFPKSRHIDWDAMFSMKRRWGGTVAAIIRRAFDLKVIPATTYQKAFKHMAYRGWNKGEPFEPEPERPELLSACLAALPDIGMTADSLCDDLGWPRDRLEEISGVVIPEPTSPQPTMARVISMASRRTG